MCIYTFMYAMHVFTSFCLIFLASDVALNVNNVKLFASIGAGIHRGFLEIKNTVIQRCI